MAFLSQTLGTLIGFAMVMLTASLIVMAIVRVIHYLANKRGLTLGEMLGSLMLGYRQSNGDDAKPGDAAQTSFVLDVLTFPTLHPATELNQQGSRASADHADVIDESRRRIARRVEHIPEADLIRIVRRLSYLDGTDRSLPAALVEESPSDVSLNIPQRWHVNLPPDARRVSTFVEYIRGWFSTTEAVATESFKEQTRRLTAVVASILVVLINLDAIALASSLYYNAELREDLVVRAPDTLAMADRALAANASQPVDREALLEGFPGDLRPHNVLLNEPDLGLGWQNGWIVRAFCNECGSAPTAPARSRKQWALDVVRWILGLAMSCVLLSLGAPFWADQLRTLLNLHNSLRRAGARAAPPTHPSPS